MTGLRAASGMKATGHTRDNRGKFTNYQQGQEVEDWEVEDGKPSRDLKRSCI